MSIAKWNIRILAGALTVGTLLGGTAVPAAAWPIPLTSDDINFLDAARGNFPGNDDQLLLVGRQVCRMLYTGQRSPQVIDAIAVQYAATPDQAARVLNAARGTFCTQAPG